MKDHKVKTFTDILIDLAESSSWHGIPKIVTSRQLTVKILWSLLYLGTFVLCSMQIYVLFRTYFRYPIQTSVSLEFNSLPFPAITFCNMNPVRKSQLKLSNKLKGIIYPKKSSKKSSVNRRKRGVNEEGIQTSNITNNTPTYNKTTGNKSNRTSTNINNLATKDEGISLVPNYAVYNNNENYGADDEFDDVKYSLSNDTNGTAPDYIGHINATNSTDDIIGITIEIDEAEEDMVNNTYPEIEYKYFYEYDYDYDFFENYWNEEIENNETVTFSMVGRPLYRDEHGHEFYDFHEFYREHLMSPRDEWEERIVNFKTTFKKEFLDVRVKMGHQKEDFIYRATFARKIQNITKIKEFTTSDYGNCYTLESPKYQAWRSGPDYGIKLTLNLEAEEYIDNFATGYGVRIVFHEPGTLPLPAEEGMTLSPGYETSIGLRMVNVTRLGHPYGKCSDNDDFKNLYNVSYSTTACMEFCRVYKTIENCNCIPYDAPDFTYNTNVTEICDNTKKEDIACMLKMDTRFENGKLHCNCDSPCREIKYEKVLSGRRWPNDDYMEKVLVKDVCKRNMSSMKFMCDQLDNKTFDVGRHRYNFLRALIYFEDLNYESIQQTPLYESVRFVSDIGGTMGLYLGASVLSFVEFLQLILEIVLYIFRRKRKAHLKDLILANAAQNGLTKP